MIRNHVRCGLDVDVARKSRVVVHDDLFPRHLCILEHQHAVGLIEASGERTVKGVHAWAVERLA